MILAILNVGGGISVAILSLLILGRPEYVLPDPVHFFLNIRVPPSLQLMALLMIYVWVSEEFRDKRKPSRGWRDPIDWGGTIVPLVGLVLGLVTYFFTAGKPVDAMNALQAIIVGLAVYLIYDFRKTFSVGKRDDEIRKAAYDEGFQAAKDAARPLLLSSTEAMTFLPHRKGYRINIPAAYEKIPEDEADVP